MVTILISDSVPRIVRAPDPHQPNHNDWLLQQLIENSSESVDISFFLPGCH